MTREITHLSTDQDWNRGETYYWFDVDGEEYGICADYTEYTLVAPDGPILDCNDVDGIKNKLLPIVQKIMIEDYPRSADVIKRDIHRAMI